MITEPTAGCREGGRRSRRRKEEPEEGDARRQRLLPRRRRALQVHKHEAGGRGLRLGQGRHPIGKTELQYEIDIPELPFISMSHNISLNFDINVPSLVPPT